MERKMPDEKRDLEFTLNDRSAFARPGETVLSVARRQGVEIPTLCHHDAVTPYGACRLCMVEVFWKKRSKLVAACIYTPYEGDAVQTDTERVWKTRRLVIELLQARCPDVEILRRLADQYGVKGPRFSRTGEPAGMDRCILCGLCVRVCGEVVGRNAISYASRGTERAISTPFNRPGQECIGCGACVFVCPTGALHCEERNGEWILPELDIRLPRVNCRGCGRPFATVKQLSRVRETLKMPDELAERCPQCRGTEFRDILGTVLAAANKGQK